MPIDENQALIAQFAGFVSDKQITDDEWHMLTKEFGLHEMAEDTERFFRSWYFNDEDKSLRTANFLEKVHNEDPELARSLINRIYGLVGGAESDDFDTYPTLRVVEGGFDQIPSNSTNVQLYNNPLVQINNSPDSFYPDLISEINACYQTSSYNATVVLSRKLLENILIDVLRARFGTGAGMHLFFQKDRSQFDSFSTLIDNFKQEIEHFQALSDAADSDLIDDLHKVRHRGNGGAHSLEKEITEQDVEKLGPIIEKTATILFDLRMKSLDEERIEPSTDSTEEDSVNLSSTLFSKSESELLSEYAGEATGLFRLSGDGIVYIENREERSLREKVAIFLLARRYAAETGISDTSTVSINNIIRNFDLDMQTAWSVVNELDCLNEINRSEGLFEFDAQTLPDKIPELVE